MRDDEKEIRELLKRIGFGKDEVDGYIKMIKKEAKLDPLFVRD